jgi:hypothetical protein
MAVERRQWFRFSMSALAILSATGLFQVAGMLPRVFDSVAALAIFLFCVFGLEGVYEIIFALGAIMVDAKTPQLERRRRARAA